MANLNLPHMERQHDCGLSTCYYRRSSPQQHWEHDIRTYTVNREKARLRAAFKYKRTDAFVPSNAAPSSSLPQTGEDERNLRDLFYARQTWTSWQYKAAFPTLSKFLKSATWDEKSQCEVIFEDFLFDESERSLVEWCSSDAGLTIVKDRNKRDRLRKLQQRAPLDHQLFWEHVKSRFKEREVPKLVPSSRGISPPETELKWIIPCRALRIVDLTPGATTIVLGSTPRLELSYVAPFLERYLASQNWARVNLIADLGDDTMLKMYQLEYHLSFYCVPPASRIHNQHADVRGLRHVSHFTAGPGAGLKHGCRQICEEQLSFIIIGHGRDVYTNIQLAERYYHHDAQEDQSPLYKWQDNSTRPYFVSRAQPCSMFLAWIATSLRHVAARWKTAIDAVDSEIESPFDTIFDGDKYSLLSDDSSFSRSKKYLWAVQVYKVFEKKLEKTISVWEDFELNSLAKLDHQQIKSHHEESLTTIHWAIDDLRARLHHIEFKREEVTNLRDGLFSTSQLLDSRISVRQNDNIKLLTYVNLLFLPLSFCTSIFGMQTVLPTNLHINSFIITICSVTVFTAFLVFNLQLFSELAQNATSNTTTWFRDRMQRHHQRVWHKTEEALRNDRDARHIPTQNRLRKSTHWMYFLFGLQFLFLTIPVYEIKASRHVWGLKPDIYWRWQVSKRRRRIQEQMNEKANEFTYVTEAEHSKGKALRVYSRSFGREILKTGWLLFLVPFRIFLLPFWFLLASFAIIVVWVFIILRDALSPRRPPMPRGMFEVSRPSAWKRAMMHLGLEEEIVRDDDDKQEHLVNVGAHAHHWKETVRKKKLLKKNTKKQNSWKTRLGYPHRALDASFDRPRQSMSSNRSKSVGSAANGVKR